MCRLFGFRSVISSQLHRSLVHADNALSVQSEEHPDGWGVAYYVDGAPHITRSAEAAGADRLFHRLSGVVASETVLAHVRKATVGDLNVLNCHPFQFGRWTFAHNGEIPNFELFRGSMLEAVSPKYRSFVLGDTDSEVIFYLFLSFLEKTGSLTETRSAQDVCAALRATNERVKALYALPPKPGGDSEPPRNKPCLLTLMVTDGTTMGAIQGGKELHFSTYKTRCSDREQCPHLGPSCEAASQDGFVNHLVLSSEPIRGENIWIELEPDETIGIGPDMRVLRAETGKRHLAAIS